MCNPHIQKSLYRGIIFSPCSVSTVSLVPTPAAGGHHIKLSMPIESTPASISTCTLIQHLQLQHNTHRSSWKSNSHSRQTKQQENMGTTRNPRVLPWTGHNTLPVLYHLHISNTSSPYLQHSIVFLHQSQPEVSLTSHNILLDSSQTITEAHKQDLARGILPPYGIQQLQALQQLAELFQNAVGKCPAPRTNKHQHTRLTSQSQRVEPMQPQGQRVPPRQNKEQ